MKRFIISCFLIISVIFVLPASEQFSLDIPTTVDVRSLSLGGFHYCDFRTPYMVMFNPSGLNAVGKKTLLPSMALDFGGPLSSLPSVFSSMKKSEDLVEVLLSQILSTVSESNGMYVDIDAALPLSFARTKQNKGFGIFNRVYAHTSVPSLAKTKLNAGAEFLMAYGSAIPIFNLSGIKISVGSNTKILGRLETNYIGTPNELQNIDLASLPMQGTFGLGLDTGVTLSMFNILNVAVVWHDAYAGLQGNTGTLSNISFSSAGKSLGLFWDKGTLGLGVGINIPTGFTKGIVSSWNIYADIHQFPKLFEDTTLEESWALSFSAGTEIVIFNTISLRVGMNGPYLAAGAGIDLTPFHMEVALYGQELGLNPGSAAQLHGAFALSIYF